jgi:hypothetical protein
MDDPEDADWESRPCRLCGAECGVIPRLSSSCAVMYDFAHPNVLKVTRVELCACCFEERLLPWLASQGARPTIEESPEVVDA